MTFEEYWAKKAKPIEPAAINAPLKALAEMVWASAFDEGYKWGVRDTEAEQYDRGHLNP